LNDTGAPCQPAAASTVCVGERCAIGVGAPRPRKLVIDSAIIVTLLAGATSVAGATYTSVVASRLEEQRRTRTKAELLDELMSRYRDPLLRAAFDLQSRLYNIAQNRFLTIYCTEEDPDAREYAETNTLYVIAEYLGWVEILRREVRFLDLGDELRTRAAASLVDEIRRTFLSDRYPPLLRIFNGQQRAIGEIMTAPASGAEEGRSRLECMGYAKFVTRLGDPDFARWFEHLRGDIAVLATSRENAPRLIALQNALVELVQFLDEDGTRLPAADRRKLSRAGTGSSSDRQARASR